MSTHKNDLILLTQLAVLLATFSALPLRVKANTPKLIVGITIDQLRTDYLQVLQDEFSTGGFRRLMEQGVVFEQVTFNLDNPDATAAIASLATGSYPLWHGITSRFVFDPTTLRRRSIFYAPQNQRSQQAEWSPLALLGSTLADELKLASRDNSRVFSIAPSPEEAIIAGGHAPDGVFWVDDQTGQWTSSTFYKDFPAFVHTQNRTLPLFVDPQRDWDSGLYTRGNTCHLTPYLPCDPYFSHKFVKEQRVMYPWIKTSPLINDAVASLARLFITNGKVGNIPNQTDMLQLTFYAGTYQHQPVESFPCELEETYLRLDKKIEELLTLIDQRVGLANAVVYVMGTGDTYHATTGVKGMEWGEFNAERCTSLLNLHLTSLFGQGKWVDGFYGMQVYLNEHFITQKNVSLDKVMHEAAQFIAQMSGVDEVFTRNELLHEDQSERAKTIRNGFHKDHSGHILLRLLAGWYFRPDSQSQPYPQTRHDIAPGPAFIFAPSCLKPECYTTPIEAITLSPTVARVLRIRAPSACRTFPVLLHQK